VHFSEQEMIIPPETRDLARRLLVYEAVAGETSESSESAAVRVYEKLRRPLCALAGVAGFWSLASRALALARAEAPKLSAVRIMTDGSLQGLDELEPQIDPNQGGAILIGQLLGLLFTFIGAALTLRLIQDAWPDAALNGPDSGNERKE
jgi:hypothetical protein